MKANELIGKKFELLNLDNSILDSFIINHVKEDVIDSITHEDGSVSQSRTSVLVSDNGSGWYRVYGGATDRITDTLTGEELTINH